MDDVPDRPASRGWYLVSFGLIGIALAIGFTGFAQMSEVVATLQRHPMPGSQEVALAGGRASIYYEYQSSYDNKPYATSPELAVSCTLSNLNGKPHPLDAPHSATTYKSGPYAGRSLYDVEIAAPGLYTLTCEGAQPFMISVGGGIGAWFLVALFGALMPGLAGLIVILVITLKRRRWFKQQREE
jgi:hypothetical protein